jgi:hypothetical protein
LTNTPSPPPGWYPDPSGAPGQRYFDGARWTEHRSFTPQKSHAGKTALWVTLAVVVLFFGGCATLIAIGANMDDSSSGGGSSGAVAGIGQNVSDGKFSFVVTEVGPLPTNWYGPVPTPRGQWVIATMNVMNTGNEPQSFFVDNQKLIDSVGREYAPDTMASYAMNSNATMVLDMNPGFTLTAVKVPFDVPPGTQVSAVELHDSAFSGGARVQVG